MNIGSVSLTGLASQTARVATNAQEETAKAQVASQQGGGGQAALESSGQAAQAQMQAAQQMVAAATGIGGKVNTYA